MAVVTTSTKLKRKGSVFHEFEQSLHQHILSGLRNLVSLGA